MRTVVIMILALFVAGCGSRSRDGFDYGHVIVDHCINQNKCK